MKNLSQRRSFVKSSILATSGLLLLHPLKSSARRLGQSKVTAELTSECDIRKHLFGKQVEVSGQIFDAAGQKPLENVNIEFWHLSPNSKHIGHRGTLTTDSEGRYRLKTDYPSREPGKSATLHFKISKGTELASTELKISQFGADITAKHWEKNNQLADDLLFPTFEKSLFRTKVNFNISINS